MGNVPESVPNRSESKRLSERELAEAPQFALDGLAALRRAAAMARDIAIETNTAIVVVRDGEPVRIPAEQLRGEKG